MGMGGSGRCRPDHILPCITPLQSCRFAIMEKVVAHWLVDIALGLVVGAPGCVDAALGLVEEVVALGLVVGESLVVVVGLSLGVAVGVACRYVLGESLCFAVGLSLGVAVGVSLGIAVGLLLGFVFVVGMKGTCAVGTRGGWPPLEVGHPWSLATLGVWPPLEVVCRAVCGLPF